MFGKFNVSRLPVENLFKTLPYFAMCDFSIWMRRRCSLDTFFLNSESTAFISLVVALSVNSGSLKNCEKISSASENLVLYTEIVVGVIFSCSSIFQAIMCLQEFAIVVFIRVLFSSQKQHVFTKMGETINTFRVLQTSNIYIKCRCWLPSVRVTHKKAPHFIV